MPSQNSCQIQPQPHLAHHQQQQQVSAIRAVTTNNQLTYGSSNGNNNNVGQNSNQTTSTTLLGTNHHIINNGACQQASLMINNTNVRSSQSIAASSTISSISSATSSSQASTCSIQSTSSSSFDPEDEESWFFGPMSRADATELLAKNQEIGAFLVRESTTVKLDLVLTVKDGPDKVSHYIINRFIPDNNQQQVCFKIGEQVFIDLPSLLAYYKVKNLDETPLKVPASSRDFKVLPKRSFTKDYISEVLKDNRMRISPRLDNNCQRTELALTDRILPCLAKVTQARIPNAYDKTALTLNEGDIIKVTKTDIGGCWEGEIGGRQGHFPFNYVEFIDEIDPNNQ